MDYKFLYGADFGYLRTYINNALKKERIKILSDIKIKEKIIKESHYEFVWFVQDMKDEIVLLLLDDIGLNLLNESERLRDKLNALITSCKDYVNELFKNKKFCEMIFNNINDLLSYLSSIDYEGIENFINYLKDTENLDVFYTQIYRNLKEDSQINFISKNVIPYEKLKKILFDSNGKACEYIIEHDSRISGLEFSFNDIERIINKGISIINLSKQNNILNKIITTLSPNYYRNLIKKLENYNDIEDIEIKRKKFVDNFIKTYNDKEQIFEPFLNIYADIKDDYTNIWEIFQKHLPTMDLNYYALLMLQMEEKENTKELYVTESNNLLSSMIVDYHFNEFDVNIFIDIRQLLEFNKVVKNLTEEDVSLYSDVLNIHELSYNDKIVLHEKLKKINIVEKFYDDIAKSKNIAYNMFKEKAINEDKIKDCFNKEQSDKYGIDIYELKGEQFVALIKTGVFYNSEVKNSSGCFSMIGDNCLGTYGEPDDRITVVYGDFDINYIIHMFTEDSYSAPVDKDTLHVTNRVNLIMNPDYFQKNTRTYNEIVFNYGKNLGEEIVIPKPSFILCYDEVKQIHKTASIDFNLPILLINTKYYNEVKNNVEIEPRSYYTDELEIEKMRINR